MPDFSVLGMGRRPPPDPPPAPPAPDGGDEFVGNHARLAHAGIDARHLDFALFLSRGGWIDEGHEREGC